MATHPPIELKRHYRELSPQQTDEVVETMADLIVNFLKGKQGAPAEGKQPSIDQRKKETPL